MSRDKYEYIHLATNERLAEMLEEYLNALTQGTDVFIEYIKKYPRGAGGHASEMIREAIARLREKHKVPFNHEAFDL